ncbi:MAG: ZIP family metal transporter [Myxococcales bacterium]|nr:ZIP family metal transporter [Myxococcales bacterium]MDH3484980.1 ZIP family metal transporter [Myxococcales bacterium]
MEWPITIIVGSVAAGAVLGLVAPGRGRLLDAVRTFAIVSSVAVVVGRLIPDAIGEAGPSVLLAAAASFLAPWLIERAAHEDPEHDHSSTMGLELSYWGLMVHKLGDGIALGSLTGAAHAGHQHGDVLTAIAAHSVPVTALMTLAFTSAHGRKSGIRHATGLAIAGVIGVVVAQQTPVSTWARGEPWIEAIVGGLLLHVVTHDWAHEHEQPALPGWPQVIAIALGVSVLLLGR